MYNFYKYLDLDNIHPSIHLSISKCHQTIEINKQINYLNPCKEKVLNNFIFCA